MSETANGLTLHANDPVALKLAEAHARLAEARGVDELVNGLNMVRTVQEILQRLRYSLEARQDAAELTVRYERRLGELLKDIPKSKGGRPPKTDDTLSSVLTLSDRGITLKQSERWQRMASVPPEPFEQHIKDVRGKGDVVTSSSVRKLARQLQQPGKQEKPPLEGGCTVEDLATLAVEGKRFGCIYADPPWPYGNQATRASTDNHYLTLSLDDICAWPVAGLAAEQAHLHLWTTSGFLPDAFRVIEAWGFTYKSSFVWCKRQMGIGNYWRLSHEFLLLGVRGSLVFDAKDLMSWAALDRTSHSSKPPEIRGMVERASPGPYLELFGRKEVKGWHVWGNQIKGEEFRQGAFA